ncbi:MAG: hypothetical protein HF962_00450 [Sulfurovum sp.]|nr:hypothetical protein [Sulfurovum sp.]
MISIFHISLYADLAYSASGTLVGKIIDIKVKHHKNARKYSIKVDMKATGIVKLMSGGQIEQHTSHGNVKNGEYYAKEYKIDKTYDGKRYIRRYLFDYKKKKIIKISIKWEKGKKLYENKETLSYFAHNDILTLYHNILRFKKKNKPGRYTIALAGAEKEGGKLTFTLPSAAKLKAKQDALGVKNLEIINLYMKRAFLSGNNGNLVFGIDKKGIMQKGMLTNVKMLGKVTLKRIK